MGRVDDEYAAAVRAWVDESCAAQELAVKIADPSVLAQAADLLRDHDEEVAA